MKKYIFLAIFIGFLTWLHYYSVEQCENQSFRISLINVNNIINKEQISNLRLEEFRECVNNKNKIDSLERKLAENEVNLSDAYDKMRFYDSLKYNISMELIFLLIGASSLVYWYSHRNDEPTHPKLFWTLIFGWLYILYYVCDKENL